MSTPEQTAGEPEAFDLLGPWKVLRDCSMDAWSKVMREIVQSDAYSRASAEYLDAYLTMSEPFQRGIDQAMTQTLRQYKIPSTGDIDRLAQRLSQIELRLDDLDARLDETVRTLRSLPDLLASIEAAIARSERAAKERAAKEQAAREHTARGRDAKKAGDGAEKGGREDARAAGKPRETAPTHEESRARGNGQAAEAKVAEANTSQASKAKRTPAGAQAAQEADKREEQI